MLQTEPHPGPLYGTPRQGRRLLACCGVGFLCFFGSYMRIPVLPLFAASLGADTARIGLINAAFMLSAGLLAIPSGLLSDRIGQRPMLVGGLLTIAGSSFLIPFSPGPLTMGTIYLLFGAGLAAFTPSMMSFLADHTPATHLGRSYSLYTTAVYLGMTAGPAVGGLLGRVVGLERVFWVSGATVLTAMAVMPALLAGPNGTPRRQAGHQPVRRTIGTLLLNRRLMAALTGTLGGCFAFGMFVSFMPLYAAANGYNAGHAGIIFGAQALANVLLRIPFGRISDRVDRGLMSAWGLVLLSVILGVLGIFHSLPALITAAAVIGVGMGVSFTALGALVAEAVAREERGVALGLYNSCIYMGMMLSSAIMGGVIHRAGFAWGFLLAGAVTLAATVAFHLILRSARRSEPQP